MSKSQCMAEMPKYRCHKEVWALKIAALEVGAKETTIVPEDESYSSFPVDHTWIARYRPEVGGYYVVYKDGYTSFSPAEAFEEGYTKL